MVARMSVTRALVLGALVATTTPSVADAPPDFVVVPDSTSPDGKWQVIIPSLASQDGKPVVCETRVVAVTSNTLLERLPGECVFEHQSHSQVTARWSRDSRTLIWVVDTKWGSANIQILRLDHGKVIDMFDGRRPAEDQILAAVHRASPKQYATAKEHGKGDGSWYRDGFAIDVQPRITGEVAWPIRFTIDITSDTKCSWPKGDLAGGTMTATLDAAQKWTFSRFVAGQRGGGKAGLGCAYSDCD